MTPRDALAAALAPLPRRLWAESAALGWHYQMWFDEDTVKPFENGDLADAIIAALAQQGVTLTREPGLDAYDAALAETRALFRDGLRPWLRHKDWCNVKTDDPPDTERCKCGLRAALASEPGLDVERLARVLLRVAYPWHDEATDDPPVMDVGDLTNSGSATAPELAAAIAAEYAALEATP